MAMIFTLQMDSSPGWRTHVGVFERERFLLLWTESCNPHALATIHILKAWIPSVTAFRDRTLGDNWGCVVLSHFRHVQLFATPWAIASQASLSMGILQERTLEWVDMPSSRGSSQLRDWTLVFHIAGGFFTVWPPREALIKVKWGQKGRLVDTVWEEEGRINWESSMKTYTFNSFQLPSHVWHCGAMDCFQASLFITNSWNLFNSCPSCWWCHPTFSSSVIPFSSHLQSFPASGSFPMSLFFTSGGQSIGVSASAPVLPMNIQDWFPLRWTGLIFL